MATFNNRDAQQDAQSSKKGVSFRSYQTDKDAGMLGFSNGDFSGKFVLRNIRLVQPKDTSKEPFLSFPSHQFTNSEGETKYAAFYRPSDAATTEMLETMVISTIQEMLDSSEGTNMFLRDKDQNNDIGVSRVYINKNYFDYMRGVTNTAPQTTVLATLDVVMDGEFHINNMIVRQSEKGLYVRMPNEIRTRWNSETKTQEEVKDENGYKIYDDLIFPLNAETRQNIIEEIKKVM